MSDRIFLKGLVLHAHHGVMEHEGLIGQRFVIDLDMKVDLASAGRTDRLGDTVSYADVAEFAARTFGERRFKLIEAAAHAVAEGLLAKFPRIEEVEVTVHKPHAPISAIFEDVGISVRRRRGGP